MFTERPFSPGAHRHVRSYRSDDFVPGARESLNDVLRRGAQMLLTRAIEAEVAEWIEQHRHLTEEGGRRQVVRNGFLPQRRLVTGLGDVYLKGISTGDFQEALAAILGPDCPGLSATTVTRLKTVWEQEYQEWSSRSFEGRDYVYVWGLRLG